jgi:hypothetical protein
MLADDLARRFDNLQPTGAHAVLGDAPDPSLRLVNRIGGAPLPEVDPCEALDRELAKIAPRSVTA